jgi:putative ABC transport system permease protein
MMAYAAVEGFRILNPIELPAGSRVEVNVAVLAFAAGLAAITTVLFGFVPAWKTSGLSLNNGLKSGTRALPGSRRLSAALVGAEVAFSVALLVVAGLLIQSVIVFASAPLGFDPNQLFRISVSASRQLNPEQRNAFYRELLNNARSTVGAHAVSLSTAVPVRGGRGSNILIVGGRPEPTPETAVSEIAQRLISEEYFRCLGIPLRRGRTFTEHDSERAPAVAIVNEQLATKYFGNQDPTGQHVKILGQPEWLTVVGVVADERGATPFQEMGWVSPPIVYRPLAQRPPESANLLLRSTASNHVQKTLQERHPEALVGEPEPISVVIDMYLKYPRFRAILAGIFAAIALILAVTGLYGVLSQVVAQRTREVGLRMALGAQRASVILMIIKQGMMLAIFGSAAGLVLTWWITRFLANLLYGVAPLDASTIAAVTMVLLTASLLAVYIPARRAASVDPVAALRED